ncbi:transposase [Pelagicoccus sp. SDUM812005]|uniref:IS66 family transposase n=1 Tax=Pelagicoccus sp. SDUM812005 TaxID=3041257 RepID=UPI00280EB1EF|nr:transposase [Pelagicoccus sp. SDUM812005]MDQ8183793.1 transposase [Pelagicoccus sp. SDUM812005]
MQIRKIPPVETVLAENENLKAELSEKKGRLRRTAGLHVVSKFCDHLPPYHQRAAYKATRFSVARQSESAMTFRPLGNAIAKRHGRYLPKTAMDKAVAYALGEWGAMSRFLEYDQAEIDNKLMENAIRPSAVSKKNWMFIGHPKARSRRGELLDRRQLRTSRH